MDISEFIKNNQLLAAAIGLASAGIVSFWIKDFPKEIYALCLRHIITELQITNQHIIYYKVIKWIEKNYRNKNFRQLKLSNGKWGEDTTLIISIGYGRHFLKYKGSYFLVILTKDTANQTEKDKETIVFKKLGRSRKLFDDFINDICLSDENTSKIKLYKWDSNGYWAYVKDQAKRDISTVFMERDKHALLFNVLNKFIKKEQWYLDNAIPYQLGILLYGASGTGKTSLIKAIASNFNFPIYYLPSGRLTDMEKAMSTLPDKCLVVIEDIDSNFLVQSRCGEQNEFSGPKTIVKPEDNSLINSLASFGKTSLSEILNALDGFFSVHGRILIATTNHIEQLDQALLRPGRFDLKTEVGYVNEEILKQFMNYFFPAFDIDQSMTGLKIKPAITVATMQGLLLQQYEPSDILNRISE